ncbi:type II toxin-antitoxin system RelE family toxin [Halanaeroarchaeum sulfurireducens]|uniref:RelE family protein n=1 Tax=Halanaeroarchaeum sulfurireducens TaxID=1604004 RepID=A0A0F7P9V5_9EURY|nr:type II toxin-antitoxin system RelE/ParE family toxin [Halanaeroarchaeum sulfurireducens]AKH96970.1 RelE family protein [Halanaeroarchaeum sulfurireducens]ALG81371.1 RelE family protein [Halanaeroarchaeum sulfurireducens]
MTDVEITPQADEQLKELEAEDRERILRKLAEAREWTEHRIDRLSGWPYYKLRAGDYRAIIEWDRETDVLYVKAVGHRRNVYDRHLPP